MTWGFSSYETRFRWAAALWAVLMTIWCMSPLAWWVRLTGAAVWVAVTVGVSLRVAWWRPRLARDVPLFLVADGLPTGELEALIRNLLAAGYRFQTVSEAWARPARKAVALTFDGGTREAHDVLLPLARRLGVAVTCFASDAGLRDAEHLKPLELREMARSGHMELGGALAAVPEGEEALRAAVLAGRHWLTGVAGASPAAFAYAPGPRAAELAKAAEAAGYRLAMTEGHAAARPAEAPFAVARTRIPAGLRPWQAYLLATRGRHHV